MLACMKTPPPSWSPGGAPTADVRMVRAEPDAAASAHAAVRAASAAAASYGAVADPRGSADRLMRLMPRTRPTLSTPSAPPPPVPPPRPDEAWGGPVRPGAFACGTVGEKRHHGHTHHLGFERRGESPTLNPSLSPTHRVVEQGGVDAQRLAVRGLCQHPVPLHLHGQGLGRTRGHGPRAEQTSHLTRRQDTPHRQVSCGRDDVCMGCGGQALALKP